MGGVINITIRTEKETISFTTVTSCIPIWVGNQRMIDKKNSHIDYIKREFFEIYPEYNESNLKDNLFSNGYGLIVIDFINNKIISNLEDYTPDYIGSATIALDLYDEKENINRNPNILNQLDRFKELYDNNNLIVCSYGTGNKIVNNVKGIEKTEPNYKNDLITYYEYPVSIYSLEEWYDFILNDNLPFNYLSFKVKFKPFDYLKFDKFNLDSMKSMKKEIENCGFKLSKIEEKIWKEDFIEIEELEDNEY